MTTKEIRETKIHMYRKRAVLFILLCPLQSTKDPQFPLEQSSMPQNKIEKEDWSLI